MMYITWAAVKHSTTGENGEREMPDASLTL